VPLFESARHGYPPAIDEVRDLVAFLRQQRADDRPFEIVVGGASPADRAGARDLIGPMADAGATWWDERQIQGDPDLDRLEPILRRIEQGPPRL
jgi:hypothetical protein